MIETAQLVGPKNMEIIYSNHLKFRLHIRRGIPWGLPEQVFRNSKKRFTDMETGYLVAVSSVELYGREREVAVTLP